MFMNYQHVTQMKWAKGIYKWYNFLDAYVPYALNF